MVNSDYPDESGKDNINRTYTEKEDPTGATGGADGDKPLLNRRSVLKTGATVAAGLASAANIVGPVNAERRVSSGEKYEIWTISEQEVYDLSDGEVLENVLVDQTADGASLTIRSRNKSGWEVRNVGFMGSGVADDHAFQLQVSAPDGGHGLIENVWANGKERDDQKSTELGGIYIRSPHAGHIDIRHTYIEGFGNNGIYASTVGKDHGEDGSVTIENCYHRDNTVSQFRIGAPGSVVRNCVAVVNDPDGKRGVYPGTNDRNARGVWGKHFRDQQIKNCAFYVSPDDVNPDGAFEARYIDDRSHGEKAVVEASECDVNEDAPILTDTTSNAEVNFTNLGESPTVDVIRDGGVPTSPKMAARGEQEMPPSLPGESGDITSLSYEDDAIAVHEDHYDTDDAAGVAFSMTNAADQDLTVTHVTVTPHDSAINELHDESNDIGRWVSEVHVDADLQNGVCDVPASSALPNTFDMANDGWDDDADEVAVMSADSSASVALGRFEDDGTPIEMVGKDVDIEIEYELDDGTTSTDLFTVTPEEKLGRTLTIDGTDAGETAYEVAVSGEIENDPDNGTFNDNDSVKGSIATGSVSGGVDGYRFSGEVVGIDVDGDAAILVDGEEVEPDSLILPNYIVFDADGSQTETTYDIEVSGDLVNDPLLGPLEEGDDLDGSTVAGTVTGDDRDGFRFSGDLVNFRLDGEANVTLEDTDG